jgi:hypothetical protein
MVPISLALFLLHAVIIFACLCKVMLHTLKKKNPLMQCSICLQFLLWGETGVTLLRWQSIPQFKLKINKYVNSFSVLSLCK